MLETSRATSAFDNNLPRVVAIIATYNERRVIGSCLEALVHQGCYFYVIDNDSTDNTREIVRSFSTTGLIGMERLPRHNCFDLHAQLARKEQLCKELEADWFIHLDADEICSAGPDYTSLGQMFADAESKGFNAVNFLEYVFVPTAEEPDHDHKDFIKTMRYYYPFSPWFPHRLIAWKNQNDKDVDLITNAGHKVDFEGLRMFGRSFPMYHYILLSQDHAESKYLNRRFSAQDLKKGWSGNRRHLTRNSFTFPKKSELFYFQSEETLKWQNPRKTHFFNTRTSSAK